jgi:inorganic triphosphatase YgiF
VEIELKFALAARFAGAVMQHPAVEQAAAGPPRKERLSSVYYDTPKLELHAAGVALRLRRTPAGWVQTLKWAGSALGSLHQRAEVESPVAEQQLDFAALERTEIAGLFAPARVRKRLKPRFVTDFERIRRTLRIGESRIELSFDRGELVAGKSREPISELELELIDGATAALFDLAAALQQTLPLRPLSRSKAERGYALSGLADEPRKAGSVVLGPQMSVEQSLALILASGLGQLQANEHGMLSGAGSEYLHQMRVAVRRLRSALGAHADVATGESLEWLRSGLKWMNARLGVARDWDVFVAELLPPLLAERRNEQELAALAKAAAQARERANRAARTAVRSRRYAHLIFTLGRVAAGAGRPLIDPRCAEPVLPFAAGLLAKRHDKVVERGGKLERRSLKELHALRIAIKKLRYASEFFGSLFPEPAVKTFRKRVADLQEILGAINDQANMPRLAREALSRSSPMLEALIGGWNAHVVHQERERLRKSWQQFRHTRKFW